MNAEQLSMSFDFQLSTAMTAEPAPPVEDPCEPVDPAPFAFQRSLDPSAARQHRKDLVKLLRDTSHRHHLWDVFGDWVECCALAIANACDLAQRDAREQRYMAIVGKYDHGEVQAFPKMLAHLVGALDAEPGDVLGSVFGELELGNAARGQFFTPYSLCKLMAGMAFGTADDVRTLAGERGFIRISEPACGAGAMVVAAAMQLEAIGINYQRQAHFTCVDVDPRAVHMAFCQLSLLHIPAVVVLGNTLTLEEREHWYTPAHIFGAWRYRLAANDAAMAAA